MSSFFTQSERYIIDREGHRVAIILPLDEYEELLEAAEELDAVRAYDEAKASGDEAIPFEGSPFVEPAS